MEFAISLGIGGWILLVVGGLVLGVVAQLVATPETSYSWLADAIAVGIGAIVASEFVIGWQAFEPVWDGLALVPAIVGGVVAGAVVALGTRYLTSGTSSGRAIRA